MPHKPAANPEISPELPPQYRPTDHEERIRQRWENSDAFHPDPERVLAGQARPYCILIPPPNVTAELHLGHALNNTLQDILVRAHRMKGHETLWIPGTDHAGIATQTVVDKRLRAEGKPCLADYKRDPEGREKFVALVQAFKDEYEARITDQLKRMGCSCDWQRQRFTMDEICARAVREAFFRLFRDGLIYRGKRLVNWDPVTQTALADDEVENEEIDGNFYYLRYPLAHPWTNDDEPTPVTWSELAARGYPGAEEHPDEQRAWVTVATTRPETYLGDTAVAVNPKDPRAAALRDLCVELPIVGRAIPIIEDDYVVTPDADGDDPKARYATGFLKVTPAHDFNDWEIGQRHNLRIINIFAPDASVSDKHGWDEPEELKNAHVFLGKSREEARKLVVKEFEARGLLEETKPYRHSVGHSYRSHAPVEPYLSDQWYVKVTDDRMRGAALRAMAQDQRSASSDGTGGGGTGVSPVQTPAPGAGTPPVLTKRQRTLPHWERRGSTYFVTFRVSSGELYEEERRIALDACLFWHGRKIRVFVVTVMPDHVHILFKPLEQEPGVWRPIPELLHSIKGYSSHKINELRGSAGQMWQDEYFDRIIRDQEEFEEKWNYIWNNPVKAGIVSEASDYRFTSQPPWPAQQDSHGRDARATGSSATGPSMPSGDGALRFHPSRYARTFETWHENLKDWCISRQLWWGHRIPVWLVHQQLGQSPSQDPEQTEQLRLNEQKKTMLHLSDYMRQCGIDDCDYLAQTITQHRFFVCTRNRRAEHALDAFAKYCEELALKPIKEGQEYPIAPTAPQDFESASSAAGDLYLSVDRIERDPDVLDTWFSSALWPMSTMGWPEPPDAMRGLLDAFNPTDVLCTAREIITLWVSRMVMFNRYFMGGGQGEGPVPFRDVFIHAMIQDGEGRKMSKSLGNGVDPLDIIETHGADAMRYTLCHMTTQTQDVRMPVEPDPRTGKNTSPKFDLGRNFANKIWNASRFALSILSRSTDAAAPGKAPARADLSLIDRWMLSRLRAGVEACDTALEEYHFSQYAQTVYDLLWRDFCDWYLEAIKPTVGENPAQRAVLAHAMQTITRLLHPIMPFITEAVWERLKEIETDPIDGVTLDPSRVDGLLCAAGWPSVDNSLRDEESERTFDRLRSLVSAVREVRAQHNVPPKRRITLHLDGRTHGDLADAADLVRTLAGVERITTDPPAGPSVEFTHESRALRISDLADTVDPAAERKRLKKQIADLEKSISALTARLDNPGYTRKAPAHLVQQTRDQLTQSQQELDAAREQLARLDAP